MLSTHRLVLRPVGADDCDALHGLLALADVRRYLLDGMEPSRDQIDDVIAASTASFERTRLGLWGVRERGGDTLVGLTGYRAFEGGPTLELIWALRPTHWGRGLATEMAQAVIDAGFAAGLDLIHASADEPNAASLRVMERLGMRFERRTPGEIWKQMHYVLVRSSGSSAADDRSRS